MQDNKLLKKISIYFIGNLATKLMAGVLVFIYAFYIKADAFGKYEYIMTLEDVVVPFMFLSIWEGVLKYILSENCLNEKDKIISTSAFFSILISIILIFFGNLYYRYINVDEIYANYIIGIYVLYGITILWQYYARGFKQNKIFVISSVCGATINFILILVLVCGCKFKLKAVFFSTIIGMLSNFLIIEYKLKIFSEISIKLIDLAILKKLIKYSLPLAINDVSLCLINGFGKILVQNEIGSTANGIYSFATKFFSIIVLIGTILNMALTEEFLINNKIDKKFSKIMQKFCEEFLMLLILSIPVIMIFYSFLTNSEYYESRQYVPILLIYAVIMNISNNVINVFKVTNNTKYQIISTFSGAIVNCLISIILISKIGVWAVVIGQICGGLLNLILNFVFSNKISKLDIDLKNIFKIFIFYVVICIITYNFKWYINIIIELIIFSYFIFKHKEIITNILKRIKKT